MVLLFKSYGLTLALSTAVPLRLGEQDSVTAEFLLEEGKSEEFLLRAHLGDDLVPCPPLKEEGEELFQGTVKFWQKWLSACTYRGRWREQVQRSALGSKTAYLRADGGDRRRSHYQSSRGHRRHSQLGLPLHLAP